MKPLGYREKGQLYKATATVLILTILLGVPAMGGELFFATLEDNKNQAESELEDVNSEIEDILGDQEETQIELHETTALLSELLQYSSNRANLCIQVEYMVLVLSRYHSLRIDVLSTHTLCLSLCDGIQPIS